MAPSEGADAGAASGDARDLAWDVLQDWEDGRCERLQDALEARNRHDPRDAALARELVLGVVRHQRLYDFLAGRFLRRGEQPAPLLRALRLAAHQLFALDRIPPHAIGNGLVELLRRRGFPYLTGVANAVIRRLSELRQEERSGPGPEGRLPPTALPADPAVRYSLPDLLVSELRVLIDQDPQRSLADLNLVAHLCTRTRPGKPAPVGRSIRRRDGPWSWWDDPQEALQAAVADGGSVVQDFSQGQAVALSAARPGDLVLDSCAAPGGKSLAYADRGCRVVAADRALAKLVAAQPLLAGSAAILAQDSIRPALGGGFDVVHVDAPCSNSGVLGRRPEARWRYSREHLDRLNRLQSELLAAGAGQVRDDGRLVYSTCSLSPRENQGVAHRLAGWRVLSEQLSWPDEWQAGGYAAVLVRSN